jgi:hypothetical protein
MDLSAHHAVHMKSQTPTGRLLFKIEMDQVKTVFRSLNAADNNSPVPLVPILAMMEGAVFDFSRAPGHISKDHD